MSQEVIAEIGETAGKVWRLLHGEGPLSLAQIKKQVGAKAGYAEYALGWLAREGKIDFVQEKRSTRVTLK
jgi:hypothetical protein